MWIHAGHNKFSNNDVIETQAYVDLTPAQDADLKVNLTSYHSGRKHVEKTITFGLADKNERAFFEENIYVSDLKHPESTHALSVGQSILFGSKGAKTFLSPTLIGPIVISFCNILQHQYCFKTQLKHNY